MAFNVTYSFNNGVVTGTATSILQLRSAIYNYAHSGSVSSSTGSDYHYLTQCTLSGTPEGQLTTGNEKGTSAGFNYGLFHKCSALTSVNLSNLDTSNVTRMSHMFESCSALTSLDLSSFDTSNVTDMYYMFKNCSALTNLDLSNFDTSKVTTMYTMFSGCSALTSLDLSSFDTSSVTRMDSMFANCSSLTNITVNKLLWNTNKVTSSDNMFNGCIQLPNYNATSIDVAKAIDKSLGGYLDVISNVLVDLYTEYDNFPSKIFLSNNYIKVARKVGKYGV